MKVMCQFSASNIYMSQFRQNEWKQIESEPSPHTQCVCMCEWMYYKPMCSVRSVYYYVYVYFSCFRSQRRRLHRRQQRHTNWCANRLIFIFDIGYTLLSLLSSLLLCDQKASVYALFVFFICNPFIHNLLYGMEIKIKSCHFSWNRQAAVPPASSSSFGQFVRDISRQHRRCQRVFYIYEYLGVWQLSIMMWWTIHANLLRETQNENFEKNDRMENEKKSNTNHLWIWFFCYSFPRWLVGWLQAKICGSDDHYQGIYPLCFEPHFLFPLPTRRPFTLAQTFIYSNALTVLTNERSWQRSSFSLEKWNDHISRKSVASHKPLTL